MRAGSGILLVALGLFVIYLGASGKLTSLGDAFKVLMGQAKAQDASGPTTVADAPNTGFPVTPGVISSLSTFWGGTGGTAAAAGGSDAAATAAVAMA